MGTKAQHDPAYRRLCKLLREWRLQADLTQRELARKLKRPHSFVYKTETGNRRVDPVEMVRWCNACGIDPSQAIKRVAGK